MLKKSSKVTNPSPSESALSIISYNSYSSMFSPSSLATIFLKKKKFIIYKDYLLNIDILFIYFILY